MQMTSAYANKKLKQLNNQIEHLYAKEYANMTYAEIAGHEPVKPDYNMEGTRMEIAGVADEIVRLKHALNEFNASTEIDGKGTTIDQALVKLALLNKEKETLARMRHMRKKALNERSSGNIVEYTVANFDPEAADRLYQETLDKINEIQLALDYVNNTRTFEA